MLSIAFLALSRIRLLQSYFVTCLTNTLVTELCCYMSLGKGKAEHVRRSRGLLAPLCSTEGLASLLDLSNVSGWGIQMCWRLFGSGKHRDKKRVFQVMCCESREAFLVARFFPNSYVRGLLRPRGDAVLSSRSEGWSIGLWDLTSSSGG